MLCIDNNLVLNYEVVDMVVLLSSDNHLYRNHHSFLFPQIPQIPGLHLIFIESLSWNLH